MKVVILAVSFALLAIASSFSTTALARHRAQMSGYDSTYKSTGKCTADACAPKAHKKK